ncbi:MAG: hypothetical protein K2X60_02605 [Xanthobacteraceae bacterium]|nr:hypothetical protein [Xanthobacteraceae bacterium]
MSHRTMKCVPAIVCLVGSIVIAASSCTTAFADECLSGPKGTTPGGKHWYYRIDRATKKHCWYVREEGGKTRKVASAKPVVETAAQEDSAARPLEPSVADARAELPSVDAVFPAAPQAAPPVEQTPDSALPNENTPRLTTRDLITQGPTILASRWPLPNEFQPAETQTDTSARNAARAPADPPKQQRPAQNAGAQIGPLQIFLCVLAIALALAAIIGRAIFQRAAASRRKQATHIRRRPIWPDMPQSGVRPSYAQMVTPERRARAMRANRAVTDEIEDLLRGVSRRHG